MKVGNLEINVSVDELRKFQESFKNRDGTAAVVVSVIGAAIGVPELSLKRMGINETALRQAQGAVNALEDVLEDLQALMNADIEELIKREETVEDGEEEEDDVGPAINTP